MAADNKSVSAAKRAGRQKSLNPETVVVLSAVDIVYLPSLEVVAGDFEAIPVVIIVTMAGHVHPEDPYPGVSEEQVVMVVGDSGRRSAASHLDHRLSVDVAIR